MPKPYSVSPVLRGQSQYYSATFKNATGERVTRGLGTTLKSYAFKICEGLLELHQKKIASAADRPETVVIEASRLFFGGLDPLDDFTTFDADAMRVRALLAPYPKEFHNSLFTIFSELEALRKTNEAQRDEIAGFKGSVRKLTEELDALKRSVLGRVAEAGKNAPALLKALEMFKAHMHAETTDFNARVVYSVVKRFVASLPPERKNCVEITAVDIDSFLATETAKGDEAKRQTRRDALRRRVGRFLNWSAEKWKYDSQMKAVKAVKKAELKREKGGIHYHSKTEVENAIRKLPKEHGDYWRCLVSMLAYAGLQLAELAWLRKSDVTISGKAGKIRVTAVDDGNGGKHLLKTDHREREIDIHPALLARLKDYLASDYPGAVFLFPIPKEMRVMPDRERWLVDSLSHKLNGNEGGKRRKPSDGLLPAGMNAQSLRRTFGSLLLRAGNGYPEVAAAMGNTPEVVASNYARLRGGEVKVDF